MTSAFEDDEEFRLAGRLGLGILATCFCVTCTSKPLDADFFDLETNGEDCLGVG